MLNYQRNRSYSRGTPTSCAVSVFGLGVVLTMAGIILMIVTKNSKHHDDITMEYDEGKPTFHHNEVRQHKSKHATVNSALKKSGPIVLGIGITIIVLFFLALIAVAWSKGLKASPTRSHLPVTSGTSPRVVPSAPPVEERHCEESQYLTSPCSSSHVLVPRTRCNEPEHSGRRDTFPENPPPYDEICMQQRDGKTSRTHDETNPLNAV